MTHTEAVRIRARQLQGLPVLAIELQEALHIIRQNRPRPKGGREPKFRLPSLRAEVRERVNALLIWRLGLALGRIEGGRAT